MNTLCLLTWLYAGFAAETYEVTPVQEIGHRLDFRDPYPRDPITVGNKVYFTSEARRYGKELWVTDGTQAGTSLAADIDPGYRDSRPGDFHTDGDILWFSAEKSRIRIWHALDTRTNTLTAFDAFGYRNDEPTVIIENRFYFWSAENQLVAASGDRAEVIVQMDETFKGFSVPVSVNGDLHFLAGQEAVDIALYCLEGTNLVKLTRLVESPELYTAPNQGAELILSGGDTGLFMMVGRTNGPNLAVWHRDESDVYLLALDEEGSYSTYEYAQVGDYFYFRNNTQLWVSDGTVEGTGPVVEDGLYRPFNLLTVGNRLLTFAWSEERPSPTYEKGLYSVTPGSGEEPVKLFDVDPDYLATYPRKVEVDGSVYFNNSFTVWRTDGSIEGSEIFVRRFVYSIGVMEDDFVIFNTKVESSAGDEIEIDPGPDDFDFHRSHGQVVDDRFYYFNITAQGRGLYTLDEDGPVKLAGLHHSEPFHRDENRFRAFGNGYLVQPPRTNDIYYTEGAPQATRKIDLELYLVHVAIDGETAHFAYSVGVNATIRSGNPLSEEPLRKIIVPKIFHGAFSIGAMDGYVYYPVHGETHLELHRMGAENVDEKVAGLIEKNEGVFAPSGIQSFFRISNSLYFVVVESRQEGALETRQLVLYRTDGTEHGTIRLGNGEFVRTLAGGLTVFDRRTVSVLRGDELIPLIGPSRNLNIRQDDLWGDPVDGRQFWFSGGDIWVTDGTPEGTGALTESRYSGRYLGRTDTHLFYQSGYKGKLHAVNLETESETVLDVIPEEYNWAGSTTPWNGKLYFAGLSAEGGSELWVSGGTPETTAQVIDLEPGIGSSKPAEMVVQNDRLWFRAFTMEDGWNWWSLTVAEEPEPMDIELRASPFLLNSCPAYAYVMGDIDGAQFTWSIEGGEILSGHDERLISFRALGTEPVVLHVKTTRGNQIGEDRQSVPVFTLPFDPCGR
ncbi:MAG: hypothetical protein QNK37_06605 [Acidobacteriota bacterium]|nr:hypothetical protein [Acidobacteriota bacterium]